MSTIVVKGQERHAARLFLPPRALFRRTSCDLFLSPRRPCLILRNVLVGCTPLEGRKWDVECEIRDDGCDDWDVFKHCCTALADIKSNG